MHILVIGSGLIGVTTAYYLRRSGHDVTVLDRAEGPGRETSYANGALLTPGISEPWNTPGSLRVLLASLGHSNGPMQLRVRALPGLVRWGVTFFRNAAPATFDRNALSNFRLALYSLGCMHSLRHETGVEYGRSARGSLRIFREQAAFARAAGTANRWSHEGLRFRKLTTDEAVGLEPALAPIAERLTGALHYETDETGDAYQFCTSLANHARKIGVEFRYRTEVSLLEVRSGSITAVVSERQRFVADRYVLAAGSYTAPLLRSVGLNVPVQPVKGYSITGVCQNNPLSLSIPVIDDQLHAAVVPLKDAIRVAGIAEFAGFNCDLRSDRVRNLRRVLHEVLPQSQFDPATLNSWCGLRPMSVDGVPLIGSTSLNNLMVNTGHGHLGWTMAAGSAELLTDLVSRVSPSINPAPYDPQRFGLTT
jgi:D-amino-acid dehydrogenase